MYRIIGLFFLLLTSCSTPKPDRVTLLLDWLVNPNHIPLLVGHRLGYFEAEGIDLEILKLLDPPSALPYLQSKQVDLIVYYMPYALMAFGEHPHLRAVGVLIDKPLDGILLSSSSDDYANLTLGVGPGSRIRRYLAAIFQERRIHFGQVKQIQMDPSLALLGGVVDAVAGVYSNIETFQLEGFGKECTFRTLTDLGVPSYHELLILTRQEVLGQKPYLAPSFRRALQKSIEFCKKDPKKAFSLYLEICQGKSKKVIEWEEKAWMATVPLLASTQVLDPSLFTRFALWLQERGLLSDDVAPLDLLPQYE